ncbi:MAG TPA: hypothetical protein PLE19_07795 [Planctomycetota bacterium]|nr:hypothetical protein [Planctomycetota bacterium]HRR78914.1 hypothetical protein [Planctomycetota bacterium]HRT92808.1 hypothetical protein [Planctomycetota bacterium]
MRARTFVLVVAIVAGVAPLPGGEAVWDAPKPVRLHGVTAACSYANSYLAWMTQARKDRPPGLLVRDGDLLFLERKTERKEGDDKAEETRHEGVYLYRASDGAEVTLAADDWSLKLGNDVVSLRLADKPEPWAWLEKADRDTLAKVRFARFEGELAVARVPLVRKLAEASPALGLGIEQAVTARFVLPLAKPKQLVGGQFLLEAGAGALVPHLADLEFLCLNVEAEHRNLSILGRLPRLQALVLANWDPLANGPLPPGMERLRSLTLAAGKLEDLVPIAHLTGLDELRVHGCAALTEVDSVGALANLKALSFSRCEKVASLAALGKLKGLKALGLPAKTTQEQFAAAVREHPALQLVEMIGCKDVGDLMSLRGLRDLQALVLVGVPAGTAPLRDVKTLRFLALDGEVFTQAAGDVAALEKALPECVVVEGGGMCLGSGWILLLLPVAALAWLAAWHRRRRAAHA